MIPVLENLLFPLPTRGSLRGVLLLLAFTFSLRMVPKIRRPKLGPKELALGGCTLGVGIAWLLSSGFLSLGLFIVLCVLAPLFVNSLNFLRPVRKRYPFWAIVLALIGGQKVCHNEAIRGGL